MRNRLVLLLSSVAFISVVILGIVLVTHHPVPSPDPIASTPRPKKINPSADIITNKGTIRVELFADEAPNAVATFLNLAGGSREFTDPTTNATVKRPFYDGLTFHRVIQGFMIQGGDPLGTGAGGPGFSFADEINANSLGLDKETVMIEGDQPNQACGYQMQQFSQAYVMPA